MGVKLHTVSPQFGAISDDSKRSSGPCTRIEDARGLAGKLEIAAYSPRLGGSQGVVAELQSRLCSHTRAPSNNRQRSAGLVREEHLVEVGDLLAKFCLSRD